jgi:hypothetical protein
VGNPEGKAPHLEDPVRWYDGRIILKRILMMAWTGIIWLKIKADSCGSR